MISYPFKNLQSSKLVIMKQEPKKYARKCSHCGCGMNEGYVMDSGALYYCSGKCLSDSGMEEEYYINRAIEDAEEEDEILLHSERTYYYTEWDSIEDANYILTNGVLTEIEN